MMMLAKLISDRAAVQADAGRALSASIKIASERRKAAEALAREVDAAKWKSELPQAFETIKAAIAAGLNDFETLKLVLELENILHHADADFCRRYPDRQPLFKSRKTDV